MKVRDICSREVVTIEPEASLREASGLHAIDVMIEHGARRVPVLAPEREVAKRSIELTQRRTA